MKVRRIDFSPDEWLAGTLELRPYDRGVYITLCALIYSRGEPVGTELIARHCRVHRRALNASLERLVACQKISRSGANWEQGRCLSELNFAKDRLKKWAENLHDSNKINDDSSPKRRARARVTRNHQPSDSVETSPYEEVSSESARAASPPLPSQGDGDAALRAREQEAEPDAPTVFDDPALKADAVAALDRCLDAIRGKLPVLDADAIEPPPPEPRLVAFRGRLHRLNVIAGEHLAGNLRTQAWAVLAEADEIGDPLALPDQMAADLDAIERLHFAEAAE